MKIGINVYSGAVSLHVARCKFNTVQMFMENFTYGTNVSANMKKSTCTRTSANFVYTNVNRKIHIRTTQMSRETVEKFKHVRTWSWIKRSIYIDRFIHDHVRTCLNFSTVSLDICVVRIWIFLLTFVYTKLADVLVHVDFFIFALTFVPYVKFSMNICTVLNLQRATCRLTAPE